MRINSEYSTNQTSLAAYLITAGFTLKDIIYKERVANFIFENDSIRLTECVNDFESLRAEANAPILIRNYQDLIKRVKRGI